MSTIVVSPTHTSFLAKDVFSQYRNAPESSLIALTLPLPAMTPLSPDSATYNCRGIQTTTSTPESLADMAEEAIRLSRQTLGQLDTRTDRALSQTVLGVATATAGARLNKFVRRLHDMLQSEKDSGVVEWRKGLLVLHSTDTFAKQILPKYFNTRNFKTFRRQLNYYGFVHVRSFSTTGSITTALWVNQDLAQKGSDDIASVLMLKRVEPCESAKTAEGRRVRKELAIHTVEEDLGVNAKTLQMDQIRSMAIRGVKSCVVDTSLFPSVPMEIQYTQSTGAYSVSSASHDDLPDLASESADSSSSLASSSSSPSDEESASAANLLLLLSKVPSMA